MNFNSPDMVKTFYEKIVDKRIEDYNKDSKYDKSFSATVMSAGLGTVGIKLLGANNTVNGIPNKSGEILNVGDEVYVEAINGSSNNMVVKYKKGSDGVISFLSGIYREAIINGNFDIWQRGTAFNTVASLQYTADRWKHSNAIDSNLKVLRSTDVPNSSSVYSMRLEQMAATGGASAYTETFQLIENYEKFRGKTVTFSGWIKVDTGVSVIPIVVDGIGYSQFSTLVGTNWTFFSIKHTVSASATQLYPSLRFIRNGLSIGKGCFFAQLQLNIGDTALPLQTRSVAEELALCQRYYEKSYDYNVPPGSASSLQGIQLFAVPSNTISSTQRYGVTTYKVRKRISPTVTIYPFTTPSNTGRVSSNAGTDLGANSGRVTNLSGESSLVVDNGTGGSLTTIDQAIVYHYTADAEL
jgi:hypothetical protein